MTEIKGLCPPPLNYQLLKANNKIDCEICGKLFIITPSRLKKNKHHTCSKECGGKLRSKKHSQKIKTTCGHCGKELLLKQSSFKNIRNPACSRKCSAKIKANLYKGKNNPKSLNLNVEEKAFWNRCVNIEYRAKAKNWDFDLDYKFLMELFDKQKGLCFYTKFPMKNMIDKNKSFDTPSIDRIDSKKGYTKDNVVFCLNSINMFKAEHNIDDIYNVFKYILINERNKVKFKFRKLNKNAKIPTKRSPFDAGYDIFVNRIEEYDNYIKIFTGIAFEPDPNYFALLVDRSSTHKRGLTLYNNLGVIDNNYRNEIIGIFLKTKDYIEGSVKVGDRLMQIIPQQQIDIIFEEVNELAETDRGTGSFGSTGI